MKVEFTQDVEKRRVQQNRQLQGTTWQLASTTSLVEAVRKARDLGWKDKEVQVRKEGYTYYVEPFEKECGCPNMLKYEDYFE